MQPGAGLLATGMVQRSLGMRVTYIYIYMENFYAPRFLHAGTVWETTLAND